jgi:hypothetical protein
VDIVAIVDAWPVGQFVSFVGIGSFLDNFVLRDEHKALVSSYVFGEKSASISRFEKSVLNSLIEMMLIKGGGRLSILRIWLLSFLVLAIPSGIPFWVDKGGGLIAKILSPLLGGTLLATCTLPFDYVSMLITKKIFYRRPYNPIFLFPMWVIDYTASLCVIASAWAAIFLCARMLGWIVTSENQASFDIVMVCSMVSTTVVALFQLVTVVSGWLCRIIVVILRGQAGFFFKITQNKRLREYPITILFIGTGLVIYIVQLVAKLATTRS